LGGGTGSPRLLLALKSLLPGVRFTVIVPTTDTGRSTGVVRRILNVPAPGDLRHCLTTLAGPSSGWGQALERRLRSPGHPELDGMAVGNLLIGALIQQTGNIGEAARHLSAMLGVDADVLPVSIEDIHLSATLADGSRVHGELEVRRPGKAAIVGLRVDGKQTSVWPPVSQAIREATFLVIGPGSLWTSIGGVLSVCGMREAVSQSGAQTIFICNTTTQPGQSDGLDFGAHVDVITGLLGRTPDVVLANSGMLPERTEEGFRADALVPIRPTADEIAAVEESGTTVIVEDVLAPQTAKPQLWEKMHTAYHDTDIVSRILAGMVTPEHSELAH
jgi:uncharacterized cofD-like protein